MLSRMNGFGFFFFFSARTMLLLQSHYWRGYREESSAVIYFMESEYKIRARTHTNTHTNTHTTKMVMTPDFSSSLDRESLTFTHWGVLLNPNPATSDASCVNNTHTHTHSPRAEKTPLAPPHTRLTVINHLYLMIYTPADAVINPLRAPLTLNPCVCVFWIIERATATVFCSIGQNDSNRVTDQY